MNLKTFLALVCSIQVTRIQAEPVQAPFQGRMNTELLTKVFHKRDQEILNVVKNMQLDQGESKFSDLKASILPQAGIEFADFDFDLHLKKDYMGAESSKLVYSGTGKYDGAEFTFSGPVNMIKLQYGLGTKYNAEMKYDANVFELKEYKFDIAADSLTIEGAEVSADDKAVLIDILKTKVETVKDQCLAGKDEIVPEFPMDVVVPFVGLFYATQFAQSLEIKDNFMELGFSLKHFDLLSDKQNSLLKPIEGDFHSDVNKNGEQALMQLLVDDNMFNSISAVIVSVDKMFSFRELAKGNPKAKPTLEMLTTSTVGTVLPQFVEEYGSNKRVDVAFSPSHELFKDGFPGSKMTGMYVDKNGNWKLQVNMAAVINVETLPDVWDAVRNLYFTLVFKMKVTTDDSNPFNKKFVVLPKNVEVSQIKVLKGDEEMSMEQMMIQSMANIQFEQIKKQFKEQEFYLGDIIRKNPKELQCFGFNISDLDMSFKKSQFQFSMFYKTIDNPNREICDAFEEELAKSPQKIFEQMKNYGPGKGIEGMKQLKNANADKSAEEPTKKPSEEVKVDSGSQGSGEAKKVVHDEL